MMTSNLLSKFLPSNPGQSIYEELRAHEDPSQSDIEERAGLDLDEENLRYSDNHFDNAEVFNGEDSRLTTASTPFVNRDRTRSQGRGNAQHNTHGATSTYLSQSPRLLEEDEEDDVPESLLIEGNDVTGPSVPSRPTTGGTSHKRPSAMPGPSNIENRAHWETAQAQQRLHEESRLPSLGQGPARSNPRLLMGNAKDKAMWRWNNVVDIDSFMHDVYEYYKGRGFSCILLEQSLSFAKQIFLAVFLVFLTQCVDYRLIPSKKRLSEVIVPKCTTKISGLTNVAIWIFCFYVLLMLYSFVFVIVPRLYRTREFFTHLLEIPEVEMQTVTWQTVVGKIMAMRDANPNLVENISSENRRFIGKNSKERLDAHDIANRLMRRENYLIAMFNKEILDLTLPLPFLGGRQLFSRHLLLMLEVTIMDYFFFQSNQVSQLFLKDSKRRELSEGLKRRFKFWALLNAFAIPIVVPYYMVLFFFRYFNEYKKNPSTIGQRSYTPLAEWKFREFNELEHLFHERLNMSYFFATRYLEQFPKVKTGHFATFVMFVTGAMIAVLSIAALLDPEMFFSFEIAGDTSVALWITGLGAIWAFMSGSVPEPNGVFDPEQEMQSVIQYTHYLPPHWENRLETNDVMREFSSLYQMKLLQFFQEIFCIIATPFVLGVSLPRCTDQIIDFFREFTVHVDGVGYVCSFAVFDFKRGDGRNGSQLQKDDARNEFYSTKGGKSTASYYGFTDTYAVNKMKPGSHRHPIPGMRHEFNHPPSFPGLQSPSLAADLQSSRTGRPDRRPVRGPSALAQAARTPRFGALPTHGSPMTSMLLDPIHQSSYGARSTHRGAKPRLQLRSNITEEAVEDEDDGRPGRLSKQSSSARAPYESVAGLGESRWETSPTRGTELEEEDDAEQAGAGGGGVLGLLYQYQKAQTDRAGVNI